jgi:hypothetical protein
MSVRRPRRIPLWLKLPWTLFVCVLVPVYAWYYGPANFLWFSNLALLTATVSLWLGHRLLAGMAALAVVLPEMLWIADFILRLVAGWAPVGIAEYIWDGEIPLGVRLLSLYHIPLPLLLLWLVWRPGVRSAGAAVADGGGLGGASAELLGRRC